MEYNYHRYDNFNIFKFKCLFLVIYNYLFNTDDINNDNKFNKLFTKYFHVLLIKDVEDYIGKIFSIDEMVELRVFKTFYDSYCETVFVNEDDGDLLLQVVNIMKKPNILQEDIKISS